MNERKKMKTLSYLPVPAGEGRRTIYTKVSGIATFSIIIEVLLSYLYGKGIKTLDIPRDIARVFRYRQVMGSSYSKL